MAISKVITWQDSEGYVHKSKAEAERAELLISFRRDLEKVLSIAIRTGRAEAVINGIVAHSSEVRDAINNYLRRLPKKLEIETLEESPFTKKPDAA